MQELIEKETLMETLKGMITEFTDKEWAREKYILECAYDQVDSLPTTVHHEYKVGEVYEFYDDWEWVKWKLSWFHKESGFRYVYLNIRPLQSEHPDITQARELASKHGMILIPK